MYRATRTCWRIYFTPAYGQTTRPGTAGRRRNHERSLRGAWDTEKRDPAGSDYGRFSQVSQKYHPDLNPSDKNAQSKMAQINVAYEEIKSGRAARTDYSRPGAGSPGQSPYQGYNPYGSGGFGGGFNPFEEFFKTYTSQQQTQYQRRGDGLDPVRQYMDAARYSRFMPSARSGPETPHGTSSAPLPTTTAAIP